MAIDPRRETGQLVLSLTQQIARLRSAMENTPALVKRVVNEDRWQERIEEHAGDKVVRFERFEDLVTAPAPEGLGSRIEVLWRLCSDDPDALAAIDRVTQGYMRPIERLDLAPGLYNTLKRAGIYTAGQVRKMTAAQLLEVPNFRPSWFPELGRHLVGKGCLTPEQAREQFGGEAADYEPVDPYTVGGDDDLADIAD